METKIKSIKVMPDYGCFPLWFFNYSEVGNIDPSQLDISETLSSSLLAWAGEFDKTLDHDYPPNSKFESKEIEVKFLARGYELAVQLKKELGEGSEVVYYDIDQKRERRISNASTRTNLRGTPSVLKKPSTEGV